MEHGYVALPSRSVGAVLGDLDVSTDAAWSTGHSAIHFLVTWSEESFSSMIDSLRGVRFTFLGWSLSLEFGEMNGLDIISIPRLLLLLMK